MLYTGIFTIIILIIIFMIYSAIFQNRLSFLKDAFNISKIENKKKFYGYSISAFLIFCPVLVLTFLIIFYFSPILYMVTETIILSLYIYHKRARYSYKYNIM